MKSFLKFQRVSVCCTLVVQWTLLLVSHATAQGFTEHFNNDVADWGDANSSFNPLTFVASGGPDGSSYATTAAPLSALVGGPGGNSAVLFRAQDPDQGNESNGFLTSASGGGFEGNYFVRGIAQVRAFVRHDAPEALTFFYRGSTGFNFPAIAVNNDVFVQPNEWTEILFSLNPGNPNLAEEGPPGTYNAVMPAVGHLQIGVNIPASQEMNMTPINFDIDQVSIGVPEPSALAMAGIAFVTGFVCRRRRPV